MIITRATLPELQGYSLVTLTYGEESRIKDVSEIPRSLRALPRDDMRGAP